MKKITKLISLLLVALMLLSACSTKAGPSSASPDQPTPTPTSTPTPTVEPAKVVEVTVPHYKSGENVGGKFFLPQVERFNAKYEGKYKITIEEITQDLYLDKIKQLGAQNMLPVLIEGGDNTWLEEVVIPSGLYTDLKSFADSSAIIQATVNKDNYKHNTRDGKLFSLTLPVLFPISLYYNEDLYKPSKSFAEMSWKDVANELGNQKIAFMTSENAWTTMLTVSSLIAVQPGGVELLKNGVTKKITDFSQPALINAFTELQSLLQKHASSSTVGGAYADAANSFMSKNSAIICNGSWMVGDFAPGSSDKWSNGFDASKVHGAVMPGNVALTNAIGYGWWIPSTAKPEEAELAKAFIEFMYTTEELEAYMLALGGVIPGFTYSDAYLEAQKKNALLYEYVNAVNADTIIVPAFADAVPSSVANTEFGKLLPKLIDGSFTPEQFCQELTKKAAESAN